MENCEPFDGEYKPPKIENVGEEFMKWVENGWSFEKMITSYLKIIENEGGESCPYKYLRETFVTKINELVKNKV